MSDSDGQARRRLEAALSSGGVSSSLIYAAALKAGMSAVPRAVTILDFGSGVGNLIGRLRLCFPKAKLHALDITSRPHTLAADVVWHQCDLNASPEDISDEQFDLVFAVEVIEHLENPRHVLRQVKRMLRPGGAAIITTPNVRSLKSLMTFIVRGHHAQFDDRNYPAHITPLAEIDIDRAAQESGMRVEDFFYTGRGTIPKFLHTYWQDIPLVGSGLRGKWFSDNVGAILRRES